MREIKFTYSIQTDKLNYTSVKIDEHMFNKFMIKDGRMIKDIVGIFDIKNEIITFDDIKNELCNCIGNKIKIYTDGSRIITLVKFEIYIKNNNEE